MIVQTAHPRSRGENGRGGYRQSDVKGSSPLTRGKLTAAACTAAPARLIPAHAGKTGVIPANTVPDWAHPRSRGENLTLSVKSSRRLGSSPLTRGKQMCSASHHGCGGLIPAHAGKTIGRDGTSDVKRAHPRSRGENGRLRASACVRGGSSPLTRGKRTAARQRLCPVGLIPAHAGKTDK